MTPEQFVANFTAELDQELQANLTLKQPQHYIVLQVARRAAGLPDDQEILNKKHPLTCNGCGAVFSGRKASLEAIAHVTECPQTKGSVIIQ